MADVILTKGGLKSQAPAGTKQQFIRKKFPRRSGGGGTTGRSEAEVERQRREQEERARIEQQAQAFKDNLQRLAREEQIRKEQERISKEQLRRQRTEAIRKSLSIKQKKEAFEITKQAGAKRTEQFMKSPQPIIPGSKITTKKAKQKLQEGTLGGAIERRGIAKGSKRTEKLGRGIAEGEKFISGIFPGTREEVVKEVVIGGAFAGGLSALPKIARPVAFFGTIAPTVKQGDKPGATTQEKIAAGVSLAFAGAGTLPEVSPFIKGRIAKIRGAKTPIPKTTPLETSIPKPITPKLFEQNRQVITNVQSGGGTTTDIGLIPRGKGFGFTQAEQKQFIGKTATITTSQRGLIQEGTTGVTSLGKGKFELVVQEAPQDKGFGLFFSQTATETGGAARLSRLGLGEDPLMPNLNPFKTEARFSKQPTSQIIIKKEAKILDIGYKGSPELETTIPIGTKLGVQRTGTAVIEGQKVELFEITGVVRNPKTPKTPSRTPTPSRKPTPTVDVRTTSTVGLISESPTVTTKTQPTTPTRTTTIPTKPSVRPIRTIPTRPSRRPGRTTTPTTPTTPTTIISPPTTPSIPIRPPRNPTTIISPPIRPPVRPPIVPTTTTGPPTRRFKPFKQPKTTRGGFTVEIKRFGKFRTIGTGLSRGRALTLGRERVSSTLAATYRIKGLGTVAVPKGFRRGKLPGTVVEKKGFRLSKKTETGEIQTFKRKKKRRKL